MSLREGTPEHEYYTNSHQGTRLHPYDLFKRCTRPDTDVITQTKDTGNTEKTIRTVLIRNNTYEVWVKEHATTTHATTLIGKDRVSTPEFNAITLKHTAINNPTDTDIDDVINLLTESNEAVTKHGIIALTHLTRENPETCVHAAPLIQSELRSTTDAIITKHAVETLRHIAHIAPENLSDSVEPLQNQLEADDHWTRIKAREALDEINQTCTQPLPS